MNNLHENRLCCAVHSHSVMSDSLQPHGLYSPLGSYVLEWVAISYSGYCPYPGIETASPAFPALAGRLISTVQPGKSI